MLITNIMLAFIAAGIFKIAHTLTCMEIKTKITVHTNVGDSWDSMIQTSITQKESIRAFPGK